MKKNNKVFLVILILLFLPEMIFSQYNEYEIKAAMIGKFTLFLTWPKENLKSSHDFKICVFGKSPVTKYLKQMYEKNRLKSLPVKVVTVFSSDEAKKNGCKILFIAPRYKKNMKYILNKTIKKPVLIIGDSPALLNYGAHICFYIKDNTIRFKINYKKIKESKISVSYLLLNIGEVVDQ